ncbi:MAG: sugar ABC transporter ATP-binding protein [Brevinema sp.]
MGTILKLENIDKSFPGVHALKNMNIELEEGELHAICGENGAGKSTLMKIITGVYKPDAGKIFLYGEEVVIKEPNDAYKKGIAIVFQETSLFKDLTVLENLFVGHEIVTKKWGIPQINYLAMEKIAEEIFNFLEIKINLLKKVNELGVADKQIVEIAKALTYGAKILILDEPTAALTNKEVRALFKTIDHLKKMGISILYISHRMEEIFEKSDRVTIIRDGSFIKMCNISEITEPELISLMVGRELTSLYPKIERELGENILEVKNISKKNLLYNISFELRKGEILGIGGLAGAGRTEIAQCICGLMSYESGDISFLGAPYKVKNYRSAIDLGILYVAEDRKKNGLIVTMSVKTNMTLSILKNISKFGFVDFIKETEIVDKYINNFRIKTPDTEFIIENLSGGNQQKVLVAKALVANPKILILDEPTRGVDVGAKAEIHKIISNLVHEGLSIIMISSDMPELLGMSDRVLVIKEGHKMGELAREEFSQEKILELAL